VYDRSSVARALNVSEAFLHDLVVKGHIEGVPWSKASSDEWSSSMIESAKAIVANTRFMEVLRQRGVGV